MCPYTVRIQAQDTFCYLNCVSTRLQYYGINISEALFGRRFMYVRCCVPECTSIWASVLTRLILWNFIQLAFLFLSKTKLLFKFGNESDAIFCQALNTSNCGYGYGAPFSASTSRLFMVNHLKRRQESKPLACVGGRALAGLHIYIHIQIYMQKHIHGTVFRHEWLH